MVVLTEVTMFVAWIVVVLMEVTVFVAWIVVVCSITGTGEVVVEHGVVVGSGTEVEHGVSVLELLGDVVWITHQKDIPITVDRYPPSTNSLSPPVYRDAGAIQRWHCAPLSVLL